MGEGEGGLWAFGGLILNGMSHIVNKLNILTIKPRVYTSRYVSATCMNFILSMAVMISDLGAPTISFRVNFSSHSSLATSDLLDIIKQIAL